MAVPLAFPRDGRAWRACAATGTASFPSKSSFRWGKKGTSRSHPHPIPNRPQHLPCVVARFGYQPPRVVCVRVVPPPPLNAQYYTELSASIATDAYFVSMMESAWMMAASVSEADAASIKRFTAMVVEKIGERTHGAETEATALARVFRHFDRDGAWVVAACSCPCCYCPLHCLCKAC